MNARFAAPVVLLALAVVPQVAVAGPYSWESGVSWSYQIDIQYAEDYGNAFRVDLLNGGTGSTTTYGALSRTNYIQTFFPKFGSLPWEPGSPDQEYDFTARVTVTDENSGESGVFNLQGQGYARRWPSGMVDRGVFFPWVNDGSNVLKLGENDYRVEGQHAGIMRVQIWAPNDPKVPEPGTIILAGMGLAAAGGWWVKKRRGVTSERSQGAIGG